MNEETCFDYKAKLTCMGLLAAIKYILLEYI